MTKVQESVLDTNTVAVLEEAVAERRSMDLGIFAVCLFIFLALVIVFQRPAPSTDLFSSIAAGQFRDLSTLTSDEMYAAKRAHGLVNSRYSLGVFGNSRMVVTSMDDVSGPNESSFNFSVPGTFYRTQVLLFEELATAGKAPTTAIFSVDNFNLQADEMPALPSVMARWGEMGHLILRGQEIGTHALAVSFKRWLIQQVTMAKRMLSFEMLRRGVVWNLSATDTRWGRVSDELSKTFRYSHDGSRMAPHRQDPTEPNPVLETFPPLLQSEVLKYYLGRLAIAAEAAGTKLILIETPIEPSSDLHFRKVPSDSAVKARAVFSDVCGEWNLTCIEAPKTASFRNFGIWVDPTHPPSDLISLLIRNALGK